MESNDSPPSLTAHAVRQQAGLAALLALAQNTTKEDHANLSTRLCGDQLWIADSHCHRSGYIPVPMAPRQVTSGALNEYYKIPWVIHEHRKAPFLILIASITLLAWAIWHVDFVLTHRGYFILMPIWGVAFVLSGLPLFIGWANRPYTVTPRQQQLLNRLHVTVAIPVYNEDPELLDRCIWSLVNSSRPPECVHVVEDGKSGDYSVLREWWKGRHGITIICWERLAVNGGKKRAQARVFATHPETDIFVTVDSDTTLEYRGIEEGLKPLANRNIASVAGIEEIHNKHANWLTRLCASRNTFSQLVTWATQSVFGDVLVNRGTFALYRAPIIREIIPVYINETFFGHPVKLGDDSFLTLLSRAHGRTVQQISAFCLPIYPETLSHHLRQWLRWSRGGSVRNFWRIRYLPILSWGWWWTALAWYYTIASLGVPIFLIATWPRSKRLSEWLALSVIVWAYSTSLHVLRIRREGESRWTRFLTVLAYPAGLIWSAYCLRPVRLYGLLTCFRQGWVTRQAGVEVGIAGSDKSRFTVERVT